jgi:NAD kinase
MHPKLDAIVIVPMYPHTLSAGQLWSMATVS